jgi:radical SAM-linked protein
MLNTVIPKKGPAAPGPRFVDVPRLFGEKLLSVEKPARYAGGEYGILSKKDASFQTVIAFPDLYEVGMSNKALRILYNRLNGIDDVSCERVFALPPDAEALFKEHGIPLCGLDNGLVVQSADLLMFTFGYELGITGILSILDMSGIPLHNEERGEGDPPVIAGGPCVSNPLPYAGFIDAFWIGEAETGFFTLAEQLRDAKKAGEGRAALLSLLTGHPHVWTKGKHQAVRAVDLGFSETGNGACVFPVPSLKPVQHHGSVEIMRGCPNGCRFCHAGMWYRPMRQKKASLVLEETEALVKQGGYDEISLSSLSSGDYDHIGSLIDALNDRYEPQRVSFQLPSLHISTLSLPLLDKIAAVRKSGLTFAVETPVDYWQISINKQITLETAAEILKTAKQNGWKNAKFYFMIGLPVRHTENPGNGQPAAAEQRAEEAAIVSFIRELQTRCGMTFSINVGVFVPKPHTPYQREKQLDPETALAKFFFIKDRLRPYGHKVSFQDPFISMLEGIMSRGDKRAGALIEDAFLHGARLDAWTDYFRKDIWEAALRRHDVARDGQDTALPWDCIDSKVSAGYLKNERKASEQRRLTLPCEIKCAHSCGVCGSGGISVIKNAETLIPARKDEARVDKGFPAKKAGSDCARILFQFAKKGKAVFLSHLNLVNVFQMAFRRAGIDVAFSAGFNPLPLLDFASPLPLGIAGENEAATIDVCPEDAADVFDGEAFIKALNAALPEGVAVRDALRVTIRAGVKKYAPASLFWGSAYEFDGRQFTVPFKEEKTFKGKIAAWRGSLWGLTRTRPLAFSPKTQAARMDYRDVYRALYVQ